MTATADKLERQQPFFQFTLRQLLGAMAHVCVFAATCYWVGIGPAILLTVFLVATVTTIVLATRLQYFEALIVGSIGVIITILLLPAVQVAHDCPRWGACQNNMRNIALALQQYEFRNGTFPPAYIADANGKPMHSWRVLLLPYLEHQALHKLYRFDEPWDGPNNSQLHGERVRLYECPSDSHATQTETSYVAVTGPQTIWPGATATKTSDIKDGPPNTILLVEAHNTGIHWMEPRDLDFATLSTLTSTHHHGRHNFTNVVFADGHHQALPETTPAKSLRAALTISGQEKDKLPTVRLRP